MKTPVLVVVAALVAAILLMTSLLIVNGAHDEDASDAARGSIIATP